MANDWVACNKMKMRIIKETRKHNKNFFQPHCVRDNREVKKINFHIDNVAKRLISTIYVISVSSLIERMGQ